LDESNEALTLQLHHNVQLLQTNYLNINFNYSITLKLSRMKTLKQSTLLLTGLLLILASCKKTEVTPSSSQSISTSAEKSSASANVPFELFNDQYNIDLAAPGWYEINSCTGEHLHITSGTWHIVVRGMVSNKALSMGQTTNTTNFKLVSLDTGLEYTGSEVSTLQVSFPWSNALVAYTQTISILLTTQGHDNNSVFKMDFHMTIDPVGNTTAWVDNFRAGCQ